MRAAMAADVADPAWQQLIEALRDHSPEFRELNPTSENLVKVIWDRLERHMLGPALYKVTVRETDRNFFAYYGEPE